MEHAAHLILIGAGLVLAAIAAASASGRFGAPVLLVFLALGMLAGDEGPGNLAFEEYDMAVLFGGLALAVILFDGGARTSREIFRLAAAPALMLATVGVAVTAGLVAALAVFLFEFSWTQGMLLGAIVSSTDAAAVFSLLGGRGLLIRPKVAATLEAESGMNDPVAVFLVLTLVGVLTGEAPSGVLGWAGLIAWQLLGGAAFGLGGGWLLAAGQRRLNVAPGLYPIFALAGGLTVFGLTQTLGASGFLAVYLAAVVYGNGTIREAETVRRALDGFAWLAQLGMFLMLGLLVFPSHLWAVGPAALGVAAGLVFIARPVAAAVSLLFSGLTVREQAFVAWTGLRGATPIFLGVVPVLAGVENANLYFSIAFAVVILSLTVQGWTAPLAARLTGVGHDTEAGGETPAWRSARFWAGAAGGAAVLAACLWIAAGSQPVRAVSLTPESAADLEAILTRPSPSGPALIDSLPPDMGEVEALDRRKYLFLNTVAPLIAAENAAIAAERLELQRMIAALREGRRLTLSEQARRDLLARKYDAPYSDLETLLDHIDGAPVSLALAQSVLATGWGGSEAAVQRNALFGRRPTAQEDMDGDPARFRTLRASVRDYLHMLNTEAAFAEFREIRAQSRDLGAPLDPQTLAPGLTPFAESGAAYTDSLLDLVAENDLTRFDRQAPQEPAGLLTPDAARPPGSD